MHNLLYRHSKIKCPTTFGLLRHGKTVWNEENRIQGLANSPLSPEGINQVHQWGRFLSTVCIDRIISSDLGRVQETVAIIRQYIPDISVQFTSTLREQSWGDWEGITFRNLHLRQGKELQKQIRSGWHFRPPGGESRLEVLKRTLFFLEETIERFPGEQILLVSHEGIVKSVLYHLAKRRFLPEEKKLIQKRQFHIIFQKENKIALGPLNIFSEDGND